MVGEQVGELALPLAGGRLDPGGDVRVRACAVATRQRSVRDIARQHVLEEELALAGDPRSELREHQLAVLEPPERVVRELVPVVEQLRDRTAPEDASHDRRGQERAPLDRRQKVDARREHGLDGVGDHDLVDVLGRSPPARRRGRSAPRR